MVRRTAEEDWDDEEFGNDHDDDDATVPCPYCNQPIFEDTPRCPYCENYISAEDAPPPRKSWLVVVGVVLTLSIIYYWIMH